MSIYEIKFDRKFIKVLNKLSNFEKIQVRKQIKKISENPLIEKTNEVWKKRDKRIIFETL